MSYCGPRGIPHSTFLSWPEGDQDKAIAWTLHERSHCQSCGTNPQDWVDESGRTLEPPPYVPEVVRCFGCAAIEEAREEIPDGKHGQYHVFLKPNRDSS